MVAEYGHMTRGLSFTCSEQQCRLDRFLQKNLSDLGFSRSYLQGLISAGKVSVDDSPVYKPGYRIRVGQDVCVQADSAEEGIVAENAPLEIVYRDEHVLVLNKPPGLTVHPADSEKGPTLVNRLVYHFPRIRDLHPSRPGIVHRLDKDTSGVMLVALDETAAHQLSEDFSEHRVYKEYLCVCIGAPREERGLIREPLGRHPHIRTRMAVRPGEGRSALTEYRVIYRAAGWSLLRVRIYTGRTHQIRVHLSHAGFPVMGDALYGGADLSPFREKKKILSKLVRRQLLHSWRLHFEHPCGEKRLQMHQSPPPDFLRTLLYLFRSPQRVIIVGSPGSGKSEVLNVLGETGAKVWSADNEVARLYEQGGDGWDLLRKRFGDRFVPSKESDVDKGALFAAMVEDEYVRHEVEHLIHPLVQAGLEAFFARKDNRLLVAEVPLFFEAGMEVRLEHDLCVGIFSPDRMRFDRLRERGWDRNVIEEMESWQWSQGDKIRECQMVVDNSGDIEGLKRSAHSLGKRLREQRQKRARDFYLFLRQALSN